MNPSPESPPAPLPEQHNVSIVIPVYQGESTLAALADEIRPFTEPGRTPAGRQFRVLELVLVHDGGPDRSDRVMQALAARHPFVRNVWLSRNFGQHAATLAGMASTTSEWVVTMDEDGLHPPAAIGAMIDAAADSGSQLVYARPTNKPPHGFLRNTFSSLAKRLFSTLLGHRGLGEFSSYRLVDGEIARSLAAYCGNSIYLDVALSWVVARATGCPVELRSESRPSGYGFRSLMRHFWRLVLSSGTRPLRVIGWLGVFSLLLAIGLSAYAVYGKVTDHVPVPGWTSIMIVMSWFSGCILFALGVIAEYLGVALTTVMGRPLYLVVSRPAGKPRRPE